MVAASNPGYLDRARGTLGEWSDSAPLLPYESRIRFGNTTLDSVFSPLTEAVSQIYNAGVYGLGLLANLPALAWGVLSGKSLDTANHEIVQGSQALGPAGLMMSTPTRAGIMATARSRAAATHVAESSADWVVPVASGMSDLPVPQSPQTLTV